MIYHNNREDFRNLKKKHLQYIWVLSLLSLISGKKYDKKKKKFLRIPESFVEVFDQESYLFANPDVREGIADKKFDNALEHFVLFGYDEVKEGKRRIGNEFPFMTEEEYLSINMDLKAAYEAGKLLSPFAHFLEFGYREFLEQRRKLAGHYPFDLSEKIIEVLYEKFDEDVFSLAEWNLSSGHDVWENFLKYGIDEIRAGKEAFVSEMPLLSECDYVRLNHDILHALKKGRMSSPAEHFFLHGMWEILDGKRNPDKLNIYKYAEEELTVNIEHEIEAFGLKPLISIVMPVYNVDAKWLSMAIDSIEKQWYEHWELCIVDDASTKEETIAFLETLKEKNPKIKVAFLKENLNISYASNQALKLAEGEYIALMDNDDELTPDALYRVIKVINESQAEFIYSDEDKIELDGWFVSPHFKPDFAPDMFLSQNYISHLSVIRKSLVDDAGGWRVGLEGAQDYDLYLKVLELTDKIVHIPKVLYHWRKIPGSTAAEFSEKSYAQKAGARALEDAMKRRKIAATVENGKYPGTYRVKYDIIGKPLVSIIIPFKDKPELLDMCINSILDRSTYQNYEIIGISNNSEESETFEMMEVLKYKDNRVSFYEYNMPFNYSKINNYAVEHYAKGKHVILLNNDIEIISPAWLEAMLEFSQQENVGAVGAKLYYPDDTIQHAGVIIGIGRVAGHSHKYFKKEDVGYFSRIDIIQNVSAVTGACLMVKREVYEKMGGLNEDDLTIAFNDVDFCLRLHKKGYRNIYTPYCEAYHHESISRGQEDNPEKIARFNQEVDYMLKQHKDIIKQGDPYYNINLTLEHENFGLKQYKL